MRGDGEHRFLTVFDFFYFFDFFKQFLLVLTFFDFLNVVFVLRWFFQHGPMWDAGGEFGCGKFAQTLVFSPLFVFFCVFVTRQHRCTKHKRVSGV